MSHFEGSWRPTFEERPFPRHDFPEAVVQLSTPESLLTMLQGASVEQRQFPTPLRLFKAGGKAA
jgi:hypothetical protein